MKRIVLITILLSPIIFYACKQEPVVTKYSIEQFYKNKQVFGGKFSEDETRLLYTSNESGIYNLYEVCIADGTQKQLTNSTQESYFAIDYVPGTNKILYAADKGGDEIDHIYLLNEDGTSTDLTPEEKAKAGFVGWNKEKTAFYFLSTKRDPRFFDLYIMDTKTWKAKLLYQNDKGLSINEISWDEKYVVLVESITTNDNKLYLVNRLTKEQKEISIPEQPGSYVARGFSLNGKYLYYTTNSQKEFQYLVSYNLETGERNTVFETNWDVINFFLSRYEKYRVIAINEDGKNTLKLFDHKTGQKVESPAIADGDIISIEISDSEKYMRISAGTSKSPADIYFYNMETKELKRLTNSLNPEIDQNQLVAAEVVRYKSFDGLNIPAIFYKPLDATKKNKVPALVWVHGGPGGQSRVGYSALIQYLTNNGYAILAVNNRGSSGYGQTFYKMDDQNHGEKDLMDCVYGKKYLQSLEYIDADKIGIIGGSYGGYMTMAAMTFKPDEFKVGVNLFGVTNWLRTLKSIPPFWASFKNALYAEMGDPTTADSVRLYNISPLFHASNVKNPVMVLQGANDPRVLQVESDEIVEAIKKNGVPVEYVIFPDEGHGFVKKENEIKGYRAVLNFLDKYLKEESKTAE